MPEPTETAQSESAPDSSKFPSDATASAKPTSETDKTETVNCDESESKVFSAVKNLCNPGAEVNTDPCLCVFLDGEGVSQESRKIAATGLLDFAEHQSEDVLKTGEKRLHCYCAASRGGAVAQIKKLCKFNEDLEGQTQWSLGEGGPAVLILNTKEGRFYPLKIPGLQEGKIVVPTGELLTRFVQSWREGKVAAEMMEGMEGKEG